MQRSMCDRCRRLIFGGSYGTSSKRKKAICTDTTYERNGRTFGVYHPGTWKERCSALKEFTDSYGVVCALKDARTLVAGKDRQMFLNTAGNSAMAKAGSGDVLAGVITGLLAQHMKVYEGTVLGVYLHACGGDAARERRGLTAFWQKI